MVGVIWCGWCGVVGVMWCGWCGYIFVVKLYSLVVKCGLVIVVKWDRALESWVC